MKRYRSHSHFDADERLWMGLAAAFAALVVALAVLGLIDMDDAETRRPSPAYNHPPEVTQP